MNSAPSPSADELLARRPGVTPPSSQARSHSFLSDALVARGLIGQEAVDAALAASRDGRRYTEILVDEGSIAEDDFARAMADHHGVDHVDLDLFDIDPLATALVSKDIARRNGALPIAVLVTGEVVVAIHDPALTNLVEIADVTGSRIRAVIASRSQIEGQLDGRPPAAAPVAEQAPVPVPEPAPLHAVVMQPVHEVQPAPEPEPPAPVVMMLPELSEPVPVPVPVPAPEPATPASVADEPLAPSPADDLAQRLDHAERAMREADERARLADYRAEGMAAAAQAASDALAQVSQACASAEEAARAGEQLAATLRSELAELRTQFDAERATRLRLEAELAGLRSAPVPAPIAPPPPPPVPSRPVLAAVPANLPVSPAQPAPPPRRASFSPPGAPPPTRPRPVESSKKRGLRRMIAALRRS